MSELTQEQQVAIDRQTRVSTDQALRKNSISKQRLAFPKNRKNSEHVPLLNTLDCLDRVLTYYETTEQETEISLHEVHAETFLQTVERLETLVEQRELANKPTPA